MNVDKLAIVLTLVLILASIAPLVKGLMEYGWDIWKLVLPRFEVPRVDFDVRYKNFSIEGNNIVFQIILYNKGEIPIEITGLEGEVLTEDDVVLGTISIGEPVYIDVGESKELKALLRVNEEAIDSIMEKAVAGARDLSVEIKVKAEVVVYGVKARIPIEHKLKLPLETLVPIEYEFKDVRLSGDRVQVIASIVSKIPITIDSIKASISVDNVRIGEVLLEESVVLEPGKRVELVLPVKTYSDKLESLVEFSSRKQDIPVIIDGVVLVRYMDTLMKIPLKTSVKIPYKYFHIESFVVVELKEVKMKEDKIISIIGVKSNLTFIIESISGQLLFRGEPISSIRYANRTRIEKNGIVELEIPITIPGDKLNKLVEVAGRVKKLELSLDAKINVLIGGTRLEIPLKQLVTIPSEYLSATRYIEVGFEEISDKLDKIKLHALSKVDVVLKDITGNITTVDGKVIGLLSLRNEVAIPANKETIIVIPLRLIEDGIIELVKKALVSNKTIQLSVNAFVVVGIADTTINIPVARSIEVNASMYRLENYFKVELADVDVVDTTPYIVFNVTSKIPVTINELEVNMTLKNVLLGNAVLENIEIKPNETKSIPVNVSILSDSIPVLVAESEVEKKIPVEAYYTLSVNVAGYNTSVVGKKIIKLPSENYRLEHFINTTITYEIIDRRMHIVLGILSRIPLKLSTINISVMSNNITVGRTTWTGIIDVSKDTNKTIALNIELTDEGIRLLITKALREENVEAMILVSTNIIVNGNEIEYSIRKTIVVETSNFNPKKYFSFKIKSIGINNTTTLIANDMDMDILLKNTTITLFYEDKTLADIYLVKSMIIPAYSAIEKVLPTTLNMQLLQQLYLEGKSVITAQARGIIIAEVSGVEFSVEVIQEVEVDVQELVSYSKT